MEDSLTRCDLLAAMAVDKHFKRCQETFERLDYLRNLSERDILAQYLPVISLESFCPFNGFTQEHRDTYMRLKLNAFRATSTQDPKFAMPEAPTQSNSYLLLEIRQLESRLNSVSDTSALEARLKALEDKMELIVET